MCFLKWLLGEEKESVDEEIMTEVEEIPLDKVKGIGNKTAQLLKSHDITTANDLADATVDELTQIEGVGKGSAKKHIKNSKKVV